MRVIRISGLWVCDKFSRAWEERVGKQLVKGWEPSAGCPQASCPVCATAPPWDLWPTSSSGLRPKPSEPNATNKSAKRLVFEAPLEDALRFYFTSPGL